MLPKCTHYYHNISNCFLGRGGFFWWYGILLCMNHCLVRFRLNLWFIS